MEGNENLELINLVDDGFACEYAYLLIDLTKYLMNQWENFIEMFRK